HLKDVRDEVVAQVKTQKLSFLDGVKKGTFTVPGDGVIDFDPVFKILDDFGYKGWMVVEAEQDPALANPFEYAVKARKYIREHAGL
ncbi:MAG TPA: myo-inosose-2 dehydratase, partial [Erwinia persicina]|nr:myo-inosose-2 dehydratase [Erwinia persicina]